MSVVAIVFADGWEHGVAPTANGLGFWNVVDAAASFSVVTSPVKNGTYALRRLGTTTAPAARKTLPAGIRKLGGVFWYRRAAADTLNNLVAVMEAYDTPGNAAGIDQLRPGGTPAGANNELYAATWNGSTVTGVNSTTGIAADTWYLIEFLFDSSANPWVVKLRIDGVDQPQTTRAITAADLITLQLGFTVTNTHESVYDDVVLYNAADADTPYPLGAHRIYGFAPDADGTHNLDASPSSFFFKDDGTQTAIVNGDTSYLMIDEVPPVTTDRVEIHATPTAAQYLEYSFTDSFVDAVPRAVRIVTQVAKSAAGVNKVSAKIREGGTDAAVFTDLNSTDSQTDYKTTIFSTKPSGGDWTQQAFNDLLFRYGYTDDATPEAWLGGVMAEVVYPAAPLTPPDLSSRKPRFIYLRRNR